MIAFFILLVPEFLPGTAVSFEAPSATALPLSGVITASEGQTIRESRLAVRSRVALFLRPAVGKSRVRRMHAYETIV